MSGGTVNLVSLGCPKNLVDSEVLLGLLARRGWSPVPDPADAELIVVNTCTFVQEATEESIETVLELARQKVDGRCRKLVVVGCLAQRYGEELARELPEVDVFWGTGDYQILADGIREPGMPRCTVPSPGFLHARPDDRFASASGHSAYLKISEGCDRRCTFCVIPAIKGRARSRSTASLLEEARRLVEVGARELSLVAQDSSSYGADRGGGEDLPRLLESLLAIPELSWIRLHYLHPASLTDDLLRLVETEPRICSYLDLPLQHASTPVLKAMGRGVDSAFQRRLLDRVRALAPGSAVRTTFIVGFPGETERDFQELLDFVREQRFERVGVFTYSREEGTPAYHLPGQVPTRVKQDRAARLAAVQEQVSLEHHRALVGRRLPVMVDGVSQESEFLLEGRLESQAPGGIDGKVYISSAPPGVEPGTVNLVEIQQVTAVDLAGSWCR